MNDFGSESNVMIIKKITSPSRLSSNMTCKDRWMQFTQKHDDGSCIRFDDVDNTKKTTCIDPMSFTPSLRQSIQSFQSSSDGYSERNSCEVQPPKYPCRRLNSIDLLNDNIEGDDHQSIETNESLFSSISTSQTVLLDRITIDDQIELRNQHLKRLSGQYSYSNVSVIGMDIIIYHFQHSDDDNLNVISAGNSIRQRTIVLLEVRVGISQ